MKNGLAGLTGCFFLSFGVLVLFRNYACKNLILLFIIEAYSKQQLYSG